jgi:oligoribonuclease NrnB/cAMP/cGMP phosphodiesterase (DHH superfamily)
MTHNDLDGAACAVLINNKFKDTNIKFHSYTTIDSAILKFLESENNILENFLIITDICPSKDICKKLNKNVKAKLLLLDHHKTRSFVNKYSWAINDNTKCGTELVFDKFFGDEELYTDFVQEVSAWDLWKLDSAHREYGKKLNLLLQFIGNQAFIINFSNNPFAHKYPKFSNIIEYLENKKKRYIQKVVTTQLHTAEICTDGFGNSFKIIFCTDYISEIGQVCLTHPEYEDLKYIVLCNPTTNTISLRSRIGEIDVSKIAKKLNGGGHFSASGFHLNIMKKIEKMIYNLLNKVEN